MPAFLKPFLISFAACLAIHFWPSGLFIWAVIWGIAIILAGHYMDFGQLLALAGSNILFLLLLGNYNVIIDLLVFYTLPVLIAVWLIKKHQPYNLVLGGAILAAVMSVVIYMGVSYAYLGNEGINNIKADINAAMDSNVQWAEQSGLMDFYEQKGLSREQVQEAFTTMARLLLLYTPALLCIQAMLAMFLIIYCSSRLYGKRKLPGLQRRPFREEIMPWQLSWAVIAGLACWLLGRDQMNWLYYSGANILLILAPIPIYYGFAVLTYWLQRRPAKRKTWIVIAAVMLGLFFTVPTIIFIGLTGLFDSLFNYRKIHRKKEGIS